MKKTILLLMSFSLLLSMLAGCGIVNESTQSTPIDNYDTATTINRENIPDGVRIPTVDENFFELLCENCDMTYYLGNFGPRYFGFYLLSACDLAGQTVTITTDTGHTVEYSFSYSEPFQFPLTVFLSYQDVQWGRLAEDVDAEIEEIRYWEPIYEQLLPILPQIYAYNFQMSFDDLGVIRDGSVDKQQIEALTVTVNGQSKTYQLGNLTFLSGKTGVNSGGLKSQFYGAAEYPVDPSADGMLILPAWSMTAQTDVVLESVTVVGYENIEVVQCDLSISSKMGDTFNMRWDSDSPLEIDEGSEIKLNVVLRDPALAGALIGNTMRYIVLNYTCDGVPYGVVIPLNCRLIMAPHDVYAQKVDGVNMLPYYFEYLNYKG